MGAVVRPLHIVFHIPAEYYFYQHVLTGGLSGLMVICNMSTVGAGNRLHRVRQTTALIVSIIHLLHHPLCLQQIRAGIINSLSPPPHPVLLSFLPFTSYRRLSPPIINFLWRPSLLPLPPYSQRNVATRVAN